MRVVDLCGPFRVTEDIEMNRFEFSENDPTPQKHIDSIEELVAEHVSVIQIAKIYSMSVDDVIAYCEARGIDWK